MSKEVRVRSDFIVVKFYSYRCVPPCPRVYFLNTEGRRYGRNQITSRYSLFKISTAKARYTSGAFQLIAISFEA